MDLRAFFTPAAIAAQWNETASNRVPYLGAGLFPAKKKAGLDLSWLKGSKGLPVSLMPSAFDAKATFRDRIGFSKIETEMPFFREGFKIKEKDRQELLRVADSNDPYARAVIERVFDDANNLIDGANVVPERMIMQQNLTKRRTAWYNYPADLKRKAGRVRCTRGTRSVLLLQGEAFPPERGALMVTYSELFAYSLVLLSVATLFFHMGKRNGKRK